MKKIIGLLGVVVFAILTIGFLSGTDHPRKVSCESSLKEQVAKAEAIYEVVLTKQEYHAENNSCKYGIAMNARLLGNQTIQQKLSVFDSLDYSTSPIIGFDTRNSTCGAPKSNYLLFLHRIDRSPFLQEGTIHCRFAYLRPEAEKEMVVRLISELKL